MTTEHITLSWAEQPNLPADKKLSSLSPLGRKAIWTIWCSFGMTVLAVLAYIACLFLAPVSIGYVFVDVLSGVAATAFIALNIGILMGLVAMYRGDRSKSLNVIIWLPLSIFLTTYSILWAATTIFSLGIIGGIIQ